MTKKWIAAAGFTSILVVGAAVGVRAGAKQIIRIENGERIEINLDGGTYGQLVEVLPDSQTAGETQEENVQEETMPSDSQESVKLWGVISGVEEGSFSIISQSTKSTQGEVIVHLDPEKTLILDSVSGYPAEAESLQSGQFIYVYVGSAMTMSLPPQTNAELVFVNIPQDAAAPEYLTAAKSLESDGEGGYILTSKAGETIPVSADCTIIPYLTRQIVQLQDIAEGRKCIVWKGIDGRAEKIVLFNES